jgi:hypothetical protein
MEEEVRNMAAKLSIISGERPSRICPEAEQTSCRNVLRRAGLTAALLAAALLARADQLSVTTTPPGYVLINAWYTVPEPALNAGQSITGFNLKVGITSSVVGKGTPGNPSVNGTWQPNPLVMPAPDCTKKANQNGDACILVPSTLDGVNPNQKNKAVTAGFTFNTNTASLKTAANTFVAGDATARTAPPIGTTQRMDSLNLPWDANGPGNPEFFPTKVAGKMVNALTFGAVINYQRASWTGPPPVGITPITRSLPAVTSYISSLWFLSDGTTLSGPNTPLTVAMGQNNFFDPNGNLLAGLGFAYTNDAAFAVDLSDLSFLVSDPYLPLALMGVDGTPLSNPVVTLDGVPQMLSSDYYVPPDDTLDFLFPETTDSYFIAEGDVSAGGVPELGFAYETQLLPSPEPTPAILLGTAIAWFALFRRLAVYRRL